MIPYNRRRIAKHRLAEKGASISLEGAGSWGVENIKKAFLKEMAAELGLEK